MGNRGELILVVVMVLAQLVYLAAQIQDPDNAGTLLGTTATRVSSPFAAAVDGVVRLGSDLGEGWRDRARLRADNERLRAELAKLRRQNAVQQGAEFELARLRSTFGYEPPEEQMPLVANVVYANHRALLKRLVVKVLEGGEERPFGVGTAVVTEEGLVGRVISSRSPYAQVQLLTDRSSSAGVMVERTRRQGLLRGGGDVLLLDYLPLQADVREGDRVVTAGIDGVYPRGVVVGTVVAVSAGDELFHRVEVLPAVDFARLDQVFLLTADPLSKDLMSGEISAPGESQVLAPSETPPPGETPAVTANGDRP